ncbi:hypothetical protein BU15DRAFT_59014 [Melanogaster broomeanus]|nr:hypothetical protein BU15DRAFT_59014 [Melanogaster broomeanus]
MPSSDEDFSSAIGALEDSEGEHAPSSESESDGDMLRDIRATVAPCAEDATLDEVHQALEKAQNMVLDMRGQVHLVGKRNALLEVQKPRRQRGKRVGALSDKELSVALQADAIRAFGRKYSAMYCLWINTNIFPLTKNPGVHLLAAERWLSPLSIKDGVKTELFNFVPEEQHTLMAHKEFGKSFATGVQCVRSEMANDVKSIGGAVFGLPAEFFIRGYQRFTSPECHALLLSPREKYTKFAPVLFPGGEILNKGDFLKSVTLVKVLKAAFFGKSSLGGTRAPGPKVKAKLWGWRDTSPGMLAAAAIIAIFILSGDSALNEKGDKSQINYLNCLQEITGPVQSLRSSTMRFSPPRLLSMDEALQANAAEDDDWELEFERAFEEGHIVSAHHAAPPPATVVPAPLPAAVVPAPPPAAVLPALPMPAAAPTPSVPPVVVSAIQSISLAMRDLVMGTQTVHPVPLPPLPPPPPVPLSAALQGFEPEVNAIAATKTRARVKPTRKGKTAAIDNGEAGIQFAKGANDSGAGNAVSGTRKSKRTIRGS